MRIGLQKKSAVLIEIDKKTQFKILAINKYPPKMIIIKLNLSPVILNGLLLLNSSFCTNACNCATNTR